MDTLFKCLWLVLSFGPSSKKIWDVISLAENISHDHDNPKSDLEILDIAYNIILDKEKQKKYFNEKDIQKINSVHENQVLELLKYCEENNIKMLCYYDEKYPAKLRNIYNPPMVIFYRGDVSSFDRELILAVVGTRKPSDYSLKVTNALVRELCEYDFTLVSGFAQGIDITAHMAAVRNGGKTIAVLGCGLDYDYPQANIKYRNEILENGVFISEYFPKTNPSKITFPFRNRILSGLTLGSIVIEAAQKSGSLVTANLSLEQGRTVFTIPPRDLFDLRYQGNAELLRDGAIPIYGLQDVLYEYLENYPHKLTSNQTPKSKPKKENIAKTANIANSDKSSDNKYNIKDTAEIAQEFSTPINLSDFLLTQLEHEVAAKLQTQNKPLLPDELAILCDLDITDILTILTSLEIEGIIKLCEAGRYSIDD